MYHQLDLDTDLRAGKGFFVSRFVFDKGCLNYSCSLIS